MCSPSNGTNTCLPGDHLHVHTQGQESVGATKQKKKVGLFLQGKFLF